MIDLHFFGKGAAFYPALGNTNAWFTREDRLYFLDFGEATFEKAVRRLDLGSYREITVLLTHLHADHAGSLPSMCSYMAMVLGKTIRIVHPSPAVVDFLNITGIDPRFYVYMPELPVDEGLCVQAYPVKHAKDMKCFGYTVSDGEETIYFSGDAAQPPAPVLEAFLRGEIQRLYHDTSSHPSESHCFYENLYAVPVEERKRVYCMHLDSDIESFLKEQGFSVVAVDTETPSIQHS